MSFFLLLGYAFDLFSLHSSLYNHLIVIIPSTHVYLLLLFAWSAERLKKKKKKNKKEELEKKKQLNSGANQLLEKNTERGQQSSPSELIVY